QSLFSYYSIHLYVHSFPTRRSSDLIAECRYEDVPEKLWPFPVEKIWGIGSKMKRHFNRMGIVTLGQLAHYKLSYLKKRFGVIGEDRKSTRLNSSHVSISYAVFCLKK